MMDKVTKVDSHQVIFQSIEPIDTLSLMNGTRYVGTCLVIKDNVTRNFGKSSNECFLDESQFAKWSTFPASHMIS